MNKEMPRYCLTLLLLFLFLTLPKTLIAEPAEICMFTAKNGEIKTVHQLSEVPELFKATAKCFKTKKQDLYLAPPDEIKLKGAILEDTLSTALGLVHLRGTRSMESLFGRTPKRAISEASQTVARVLRQAGWPYEISLFQTEWNIIFLDERLPETQIPYTLISNCHPGWMTPPANVYIVSQRIAAGCAGAAPLNSRNADAEMMQVLLHEFGHVIEWKMLDGQDSGDRARAEGFATWFEYYSGGFSEITRDSATRKALGQMISSAAKTYTPSPLSIATADAYSNAAVPFTAIVERRGIRGLSEVYRVLREDKVEFSAAVQKALGWKTERLREEARRLSL